MAIRQYITIPAILGLAMMAAPLTAQAYSTSMPSTLDRSELPPSRPPGFSVSDRGSSTPTYSSPLDRALANNRNLSAYGMGAPVTMGKGTVTVGKTTYSRSTGQPVSRSDKGKSSKGSKKK